MKNLVIAFFIPLFAGCTLTDFYGVFPSTQEQVASSGHAKPTMDGFQYREVYRYKGTVCDAADVTLERVYSQTVQGAEVFEATAPVTTPSEDASTPTTSTTTVTTDEQAAERIAEALDKLIPPKKKSK